MSQPSSRFIAQCPLCSSTYSDEGVRLIKELHSAKLFHCTCRSCGHAMMAVILESGGWVSSVGLMTDLEAPDAVRLQSAGLITVDECVRLHKEVEERSRELCQELMRTTAP